MRNFCALMLCLAMPMIGLGQVNQSKEVQEVVVTGSAREVQKTETALPIESYKASFFERSRPQGLLDATSQIVGLRPQINCSVCSSGDIHMNGMEGPYTAILMDGMPVVSSLASIYGLSGIPLNMIERIEVVKGPASALYGSEAMAGIINVITKKADKAQAFFIESSLSSQLEWNTDLAFSSAIGKRVFNYTALNHFRFQNPMDVNGDNFTDLAQQTRYSLFSKFQFANQGQIALRYLTEDRWGMF